MRRRGCQLPAAEMTGIVRSHVAAGLSMGIGRVSVGFRDGLGQNNYTEGEGKREEYPKVSCKGRRTWRATRNRGTGRGGVCR